MNWQSISASATADRGLSERHLASLAPVAGERMAYAMASGPQSYQAGSESAAFAEAGDDLLAQPNLIALPRYYYPGASCGSCGYGTAREPVRIPPRSYSPMPAAEEWGPSAMMFAPTGYSVERHPSLPVREVKSDVRVRRDYPSTPPLLGFDPQQDGEVATSRDAAGASPGVAKPRRWSMDAWAFMRRDGDLQLANGLLPATYGANQIGSVLRFRLMPRSRLEPALYLRTDSTTGTGRYATVAAGASLRPLARLPITIALEGRMLDDSAGRHYQPAVLAVTQLPRFRLTHGLAGEVYAQGGWVGGRYATPFADGQVRIDHGLLTLGKLETRVGLGGWGGVQKGASRLDVGPTMSRTAATCGILLKPLSSPRALR